ncbi:substrate-binding periplasmic protein [Spartinivicinus ruber]|uniref:substrate-binding periplasmic protein n=1 Tax=Spartinivicinus ruber TaxID=2683272 RepID=UPI0013D5EDA6|nr:transporter substrate-binding domain-containing protein [Spartinivicinus ruber]
MKNNKKLCQWLVSLLSSIMSLAISPILQAKALNIVTINYPPYIIDENNGIAIESVKAALDEMKVEYNIKIKTWKYSYQRAVDGRADAIFTIYKTNEREKLLLYSSVNIIKQGPALFYMKKNKKLEGKKTVSANELGQYIFGAINKFNYGEKFDLMKKSNTVSQFVYSHNLDQSLKKLLRGKSDLIIHDEYAFLYRVSNSGLSKFVSKLEFDLGNKNSYIAFSRKTMDQDFVKKFDFYLEQFIKSQEYKALLSKYTSQ